LPALHANLLYAAQHWCVKGFVANRDYFVAKTGAALVIPAVSAFGAALGLTCAAGKVPQNGDKSILRRHPSDS
jgi:hypothetical protein